MEEAQVAAGNFKTPLSERELKHLEGVIGELERKTSGEIRLIIVGRSMPPSVKILSGTMVLALILLFIERHLFLAWVPDLVLLAATLVVSFVIGILLSRIPAVVRNLSSPFKLRHHALMRAELEFYREGLGETKDRTGILLFLSLLEHQAVVLADKGIAGRLKPDIWNEVVATMLEGPKTGQWQANLEKALRQCGGVLAQHFPIQEGDRNELPNLVIVKP